MTSSTWNTVVHDTRTLTYSDYPKYIDKHLPSNTLAKSEAKVCLKSVYMVV